MAVIPVVPPAGSVRRRRLLGCVVVTALFVGGALAVVPHPRAVVALALADAPTRLPVPVAGIAPKALADTWNAPRGGSRRHRGIDIFARRGTAVLSPVDGLVLDIGNDRLGGKVVKILGPGPQVHYFAHLDDYGRLRERGLVGEGDVVGYVGTTGNARGTPPHLHYGIYVLPGSAINPYPLLTGRG